MQKFIIAFFMSILLTTNTYAEEFDYIIADNSVEMYNEEQEEIQLGSRGVILYDATSGRILYGENVDEQLPMASTTKIMTLIVALENGNLDDTVVVSKKASKAPKVKMYLSEGEEIKLENLLYALMLESSNDAAIAIAEHIGGSVEEFCVMMTEKAKELGAVNTSFKTPNGLDADGHYSTPRDLAIITSYGLQNDKFIEITNTKSKTFSSNKKQYSVTNKNRLLNEYSGANGVKTGFTGLAGQCFVGAAKRDGMQLVTVVLQSGWGNSGKEQKWIDTKRLLNYGFENYKYYEIINKEEKVGDIKITNSKTTELPIYINGNISIPLTEEEKNNIKIVPIFEEVVEAPLEKNQVVGKVEIRLGNEVLKVLDIYVKDDAILNTINYNINKVINYWLNLGYMQ